MQDLIFLANGQLSYDCDYTYRMSAGIFTRALTHLEGELNRKIIPLHATEYEFLPISFRILSDDKLAKIKLKSVLLKNKIREAAV